MLAKTRGLVLKEIKYRDTSAICSLYTRDFGKISIILKGGRNPKNRLSGLFITGNLLEVVLYRTGNRNLSPVREARIINSPMASEPDLDRFSTLYRIIDIVRNTTGSGEKSPRLFDALSQAIETLSWPCQNTDAVLAWFFMRLVSILGFEPSIEQCVLSGKPVLAALEAEPETRLFFLDDPGGIMLQNPAVKAPPGGRPVPTGAYLLMRTLRIIDTDTIDNLQSDRNDCRQVCDILQHYCSFHSEDSIPVKNRKVINQILSHPQR